MYRVRTLTTGVAGGPWYTNMYFQGTAPLGAAQAVDQVMAFWDSFNEMVVSNLTMTVQGDVAVIDPVDGEIQAVHATGGGGSIPGTNGGGRLPDSTTALLRLKTGVYANGRQVQGRINFGGMVEEESDNGVPSTDLMFKLRSDVQTFLQGDPAAIGVWSRARGQFYEAATVDVWTQWAVLRSHRN